MGQGALMGMRNFPPDRQTDTPPTVISLIENVTTNKAAPQHGQES